MQMTQHWHLLRGGEQRTDGTDAESCYQHTLAATTVYRSTIAGFQHKGHGETDGRCLDDSLCCNHLGC